MRTSTARVTVSLVAAVAARSMDRVAMNGLSAWPRAVLRKGCAVFPDDGRQVKRSGASKGWC